MNLLQLGIGSMLAAGVAGMAWRLGHLSTTGAAAAIVVGGLVFGFGGWEGTLLLLLFFASSSALSRAGGLQKASLEGEFAKTGRRDGGQVLANGAMAAAFACAHAVTGEPGWKWGMAGALAAANADTWATELGVVFGRQPRLITTGVLVAAGTSGAVTLAGLGAALAGSLLIGLAMALMPSGAGSLGWVAAAGLLGSLVDSLLGATVQGIYYCPVCRKSTERWPLHGCGKPTLAERGWRWFNNDWVNFAATLAGGLLAWGAATAR
jgi:uncharacterized protein (TIGR00297 family)